MSEEKELTRIKVVVHTTSGKTFESRVMEMTEEKAQEWYEILAQPKIWSNMYIPLVHALDWNQKVFFNPAFVVAVEVIIVPENLS